MEEITLHDLRIGDAGWLIQRHAELYARDEGFDASFEALVAEVLADYIRTHEPRMERAWIARRDGHRLGSIFCVRQDKTTAKLRLFLVEPEARGTGLGHRLLKTCMDWARARGYGQMQLWTHESHRAACALYARNGWRCTTAKQVRNFGVDLVEQAWEIDL
jgi:GNAT superfamily N-acetyltransferase